jgi:hypothetical protein
MLHIASLNNEAHCMAAWDRRTASDGRHRSIRRATRLLSRIESGVGSDSRKIEHGSAKPCVLEVDQPEPAPIVNEIGRQQIVVPEYDRQVAA